MPSSAAFSGLGAPTGGIISARSFRITFSHTSALLEGRAKSAASNESPAVFSFWLWQVMQYLSSTARSWAIREGQHRQTAIVMSAKALCFILLTEFDYTCEHGSSELWGRSMTARKNLRLIEGGH